MDIGEVALMAKEANVIGSVPLLCVSFPAVLMHAKEPAHPYPLGELVVVRRHHPTFSCKEVFCRIQAKAGHVGKGPDFPYLVFPFKRMGGVLDHPQMAISCDI